MIEQDQSEVVAFLERPASYAWDGRVDRVDTHIAMVFLVGGHAYKLKRAVRLPFLDFSSVAKRETACRTELSLNRRTAPDLYLEVRSINRQDDGSLGFGPGEPVDWIVVMRRFAAEDLLEAVASRGDLSAGLVRTLADRIAHFHETAEIVQDRHGASRVRRVIDGNATSFSALAPVLPKEACAALHDRSLAAWRHLEELLDHRAASGHVRHCHGDLHLANICLWQGEPTLFDCLEFDAELATIDVLYDLAFLLMDLWERGLREQASLLFNRYLDMREESDGLAILPLFLSMRAAIRAYVSANAADLQTDTITRQRKHAAAHAYLTAALAFLSEEPTRLIAIGGLSGTGKSTLAARLAPQIGSAPGARWLRTDVLRKRLAGLPPEARLPREAYTQAHKATVYSTLLEAAAEALAAGRSVIVDAVFATPGQRQAIAEVASRAGVGFAGLWLEAPLTTLIARVDARTDDASDASRAEVERQAELKTGDLGEWRRIAADCEPDKVRAAALAALA